MEEESTRKDWVNARVIGYTPITDLWQQFTMVEEEEEKIKDTFRNAFDQYKNSYKELTELAIILNHKGIYWINKNENKVNVYDDLYYYLIDFAQLFLKGEELNYFNKWVAPNNEK